MGEAFQEFQVLIKRKEANSVISSRLQDIPLVQNVGVWLPRQRRGSPAKKMESVLHLALSSIELSRRGGHGPSAAGLGFAV